MKDIEDKTPNKVDLKKEVLMRQKGHILLKKEVINENFKKRWQRKESWCVKKGERDEGIEKWKQKRKKEKVIGVMRLIIERKKAFEVEVEEALRRALVNYGFSLRR